MTRTGLRAVLLTAGVLLGLLALPAAGITPGPSPEPSPTITREPVPDVVAAWFAEDGQEAVEQATLGVESDDLRLGHPHQVARWSPDYIAGDSAADPARTVEEWIAPVTSPPLEEDEDRVAVGVVWAGSDDGPEPELFDVLPEPDLAAALDRLPGGATVVYDTGVEGWFAIADSEVWPLNEQARTLLQGSAAVDVFQDFVHQRLGDPTSSPVPVPQVEEEDELSPLVPIVAIVVLGAGTAWLLLRQYRRDDSRLAADIRAGVSPPSHGPDR